MATDMDPSSDNEIECARCGAHFYYELTRCPNCGVNLYDPSAPPPASRGFLAELRDLVRRILGQPTPVDELFGVSLAQAQSYNDLLRKVGGDRQAVERLIDFERRLAPQATRAAWLQSAIRSWESDNRSQP